MKREQLLEEWTRLTQEHYLSWIWDQYRSHAKLCRFREISWCYTSTKTRSITRTRMDDGFLIDPP